MLIIMYRQNTKYGTIVNVIIFIGIIIGYGTWNFNTMAKNELEAFAIPAASEKKVMTKEMISDLPLIVQKWVERSSVIGKEIIYSVHLKQIGEMRTTPAGKTFITTRIKNK